jgi:hypothetical protein
MFRRFIVERRLCSLNRLSCVGPLEADGHDLTSCTVLPNSHASTWKCARLAEHDHTMVTGDVALH